ncbi:uncharacterized protein LY89DRAFT_779465 [Mollisia scopiformis]|uniref:DUF6590 domain-containing protein n=1 Tax=Mollisia scopiformis TaxID=149040 RepID=A0A194XKL0_MOLSC|nr:uncharacterized protein LY89DRAFT_779465 [Mollisia scopiformis]KUJ20750.1 hypothetical protein LY89DRAFT_779465 [Mollisia scopiformis]
MNPPDQPGSNNAPPTRPATWAERAGGILGPVAVTNPPPPAGQTPPPAGQAGADGALVNPPRGPLATPTGGDPRPNAPFQVYGAPLGFNHLTPGVIISFPQHAPHWQNPPRGPLTNYDSISHQGHWVESKIRKFIVIERRTHHCIVLPMFTHGGRGLSGKQDRHRMEYIGVLDAADWDRPDLASENAYHTPNGSIWATRAPAFARAARGSFHWISPAAYVQHTAPQRFDYSWPCLLEGGIFTPADLALLLAKYYENCPRPHYELPQLIPILPLPLYYGQPQQTP